MAYPTQLAGNRNHPTFQYSLIQGANTAIDLDTRIRATQHAYGNTTAAEFEANGAPVGSGVTYQQMMTDFATFLNSAAWTKMMQYVDQIRDITR